MTAGYIYILINPSHQKNMLKIGMTGRDPEERARELSSGTGIPAEYIVAYEEPVPDMVLAEQLVHTELARYRVKQEREFFSLPLKDAVSIVQQIAKKSRDDQGIDSKEELQETIKSQSVSTYEVDVQIRSLLKMGRKIEAIKLAREEYSLGLKDAKDYVENNLDKSYLINAGSSKSNPQIRLMDIPWMNIILAILGVFSFLFGAILAIVGLLFKFEQVLIYVIISLFTGLVFIYLAIKPRR